MVYYTDFKRWWETEPVLVAAHVQQILEVTASLYYQEQSALAGPSTGRDLPKLGKEFMQSLEQPSDDCTDYVAFDTVKVGMQVRMTPTGFSKEHRYLGTVIGPSLEEGGPQMNGHVVMHWRTPEEGGPPQSADAKSLSQSSKYDDILGKIEDMMRNQWRVQEDIEAIMPRERIEMKEWWEGGGRPERILPFDEIKPFPPAREGEDATTLPFLPDGRIVTMSPEGVPDALLDEHRYPATIIGRLADKVVLYWHPLPEAEAEQAELNVQKGAVRRPEGECQVPQSWWEGRGRPARTTGWYSDHDSWLLRKLEANGGVMPLDAKKGKKGKKGKKK